jgi:hypothetical protein
MPYERRMAARITRNGNLAEAITLLIRNQAAYVGDLREHHKEIAEIRRDLDQIKAILIRHEQLLVRHEQLLTSLPEAIRDKIGFKPKSNQP